MVWFVERFYEALSRLLPAWAAMTALILLPPMFVSGISHYFLSPLGMLIVSLAALIAWGIYILILVGKGIPT